MVQANSTEARVAALIAEILRDAPWRKRAQLNAEFDQACLEFDAMQVRARRYTGGRRSAGGCGRLGCSDERECLMCDPR